MDQAVKGKWAVLIGINFYAKGMERGGLDFKNLKGCVADVTLVESVLLSCYRVSPSNLIRLTATASTNAESLNEPIEPAENRPTYENIVDTFLHVTEQANPGDSIYIHYSGHGGRAKTIFPHLKQPRGQLDLDEVLVPYNINSPGGRYIRDIEIAALLKGMVDKGLVVTMVIDACYSAGATRSSAPTLIRGLSEVDKNVLRGDRSILPPVQLERTARLDQPSGSRAAKRLQNWLIEPRGYTLLAACRSHEEAVECQFDGTWHGVFTYALIDSLNLGWYAYTYEMIHNRVCAKVNARFKRQTPILSGEGDRIFFESNRIRPLYSTTVIEVAQGDQIGGTVTLGSGSAHGINIANEFAIYQSNMDPNHEKSRLAAVRVTGIEPGRCTTVITELHSRMASEINVGDSAVLTTVNSPIQQRTVRILALSPHTQSNDHENALSKLREQLKHNSPGFTSLVQDDYLGPTQFQVVINNVGQYEIWDTNHQVIENLYPPIIATDVDAVERIMSRLTHLAKYHNVWELDNPDRSCQISTALSMTIVGWRLLNSKDVNKFDVTESLCEVDSGDVIILEVKNTAKNGRPFNFALLDLKPGWSITQIHPFSPGAHVDVIEPGQNLRLEFQMVARENTPGSHIDLLKVFAVEEPTSFRSLELPSLDEKHKPAVSRSPRPGSLEDILESFNTNRKAVRLPSGSNWATSSITVRTRYRE